MPSDLSTGTDSRGPEFRRRMAICPNRENHTEGPGGYREWHEWAEEMSETHDQTYCPACGMFVIWAAKTGAVASDEERQ